MDPIVENTFSMSEIPDDSWEGFLRVMKAKGEQMASDISERNNGARHHIELIGQKIVRKRHAAPVAGAPFRLDWKTELKLEIVDHARTIITDSYIMGSLDPFLPAVLASVIKEESLYKHSYGEFFELYGKFEQKYGLKGPGTRKKMEKLTDGKPEWSKEYFDGGRKKLYPLPYAVRQILAHQGQNPNKLDKNNKDIETSISLLNRWVK